MYRRDPFFFLSFPDWLERRGIISAYDAADSTNSTGVARKNSTEKSQQTAETRKMRFTLGLVDKYNYKLLQFNRYAFDIEHIAEKNILSHCSFPARLSTGLKRAVTTLKAYS